MGAGIVLFVVTSVASAATPDIRVLIDISGNSSTDAASVPLIPALKLLIEVLPLGVTAGVWLFAETPTEMMAPSMVNLAWKATERTAAGRTRTQGLHTDLEAALQAATRDWSSTTESTDRHVIILTSGRLIGQDPAANGASEARIMGAGLRALQAQSAKVEIVALADLTDRAMLSVLVTGTEGWFEQVTSSSALQPVFLKVFEEAARPDALPIVGNQFTVDTSVRELTLLLFREADVPALALTSPDGTVWTIDSPTPFAWIREADYDLVSITAPKAGTWSFNAAADPDNRAFIASDLALSVNDFPLRALPGEPVAVVVQLLEQGIVLNRPEFLQIVKADVAITGEAGDVVSALSLDLAAARFTGTPVVSETPGDYQVVVRLNGGTFQRERHQLLKVIEPPFTFSAEPATSDNARVIHFTITANAEEIAPESFAGLLELVTPDAPARVLELPSLDGNEITLELGAATRGDYTLRPWIFADTRAARTIRIQPEPISIFFGDGSAPKSTGVDAPAISEISAPVPAFEWPRFAQVVALGNLGVGSVIAGLWFSLRRRGIPVRGTTL